MKSTRYRQVVTAITILLAAMQFQGCATSLTEEERYEAKAQHAERMDEIRQFISTCEGAKMVALYYGPTTNKLRNPLKQIPRHADLSDYACATQQDLSRAQREMGIRM